MFKELRQALLGISIAGGRRETVSDFRRLLAMAASSIRTPGGFRGAVDGIARMMEMKDVETSTWVQPDAVVGGGRFDACNLRHWLALAEAAGIPFVPAVPILTLTEEEVSALSGTLGLEDSRAVRAIRKAARDIVDSAIGADAESGAHEADGIDASGRAALMERTFSVMDDVPEGWMVRHERCGPSTLKTMAGCGVSGPEAPDVSFGPSLSVGPGWIRNGNRRRVDVADARTLKVGIGQGPDAPHTWLARPWIKAARWTSGEDPHRHGSQFAGKGFWPAEWRVFVEGGRVVGVSYYYPWAGRAEPQDAIHALRVGDVAQALVDFAVEKGAVPAFMDIEFARGNRMFREMGMDERLPRDGFACCLDFIEVEADDGSIDFVLLEGGPPLCGFGGAHPCGFISVVARTHAVSGVALKLPDGVHMMEPSTWDVPVDGAILTWEETEALAGVVPGSGMRPSGRP